MSGLGLYASAETLTFTNSAIRSIYCIRTIMDPNANGAREFLDDVFNSATKKSAQSVRQPMVQIAMELAKLDAPETKQKTLAGSRHLRQ